MSENLLLTCFSPTLIFSGFGGFYEARQLTSIEPTAYPATKSVIFQKLIPGNISPRSAIISVPTVCLNRLVLIDVCSVDLLFTCLRISTGFKGRGFPSERRIYESTLVGQTKLLSQRVSKVSTYQALF